MLENVTVVEILLKNVGKMAGSLFSRLRIERIVGILPLEKIVEGNSTGRQSPIIYRMSCKLHSGCFLFLYLFIWSMVHYHVCDIAYSFVRTIHSS